MAGSLSALEGRPRFFFGKDWCERISVNGCRSSIVAFDGRPRRFLEATPSSGAEVAAVLLAVEEFPPFFFLATLVLICSVSLIAAATLDGQFLFFDSTSEPRREAFVLFMFVGRPRTELADGWRGA